MNAPFMDCTRFKGCSVNNCPLHPDYPNIYTDPEDKQQRCTLGKVYRMRISENYPGVLSMAGMTRREYAAKKAWEAKSPEEQAGHKAQLKKIGFASAPQTELNEAGVTVGEGSENDI